MSNSKKIYKIAPVDASNLSILGLSVKKENSSGSTKNYHRLSNRVTCVSMYEILIIFDYLVSMNSEIAIYVSFSKGSSLTVARSMKFFCSTK